MKNSRNFPASSHVLTEWTGEVRAACPGCCVHALLQCFSVRAKHGAENLLGFTLDAQDDGVRILHVSFADTENSFLCVGSHSWCHGLKGKVLRVITDSFQGRNKMECISRLYLRWWRQVSPRAPSSAGQGLWHLRIWSIQEEKDQSLGEWIS